MNKVVDDEETAYLKHFESTFGRNKGGRFVVRLPLKGKPEQLSKLYNRAVNSLCRLERKSKPDLKVAVNLFMKDYEDRRHITLTSDASIDKSRYFIPYQIVVRPSSTTTKVRVVFNASARTEDSLSLNDILMKGPPVQPDILTILTKFRKHQIAFITDIQQMYHQIQIHADDSKLQKILWRYNLEEPMKEYELTTLTYGTTPASFIAMKCLDVIAQDIKNEFPDAARAIKSNFYMDDLMTGANTIDAAIELQEQIHSSLLKYCFPLRKYVSNSPDLMKQLDKDLVRSTNKVNLSFNNEVLVLGLIWIPSTDQFQIRLNLLELPMKITK